MTNKEYILIKEWVEEQKEEYLSMPYGIFTDGAIGVLNDLVKFLKGLLEGESSRRSEERCVYKHVDEFEYWETGCKHSSWYKHMDVEHKFCPYCGGKIHVKE